MRILIVTQYFWPENFRITDLAIALKDKGHEVTVLTGMPNYPAGKLYDGYSWWKNRRETMQTIPIVRVPLFVRRESRSWQLVLNYCSFVFFACLLAPWLLRKQPFEVIFTYEVSPVTVGIPAILMSRLKNAPMFFWVQDLWPETLFATGAVKSPRILSAVGLMVKKIYQGCDRILVQSQGFVEPAVAAGAEREKIKYFPNWAESLYQPKELEPSAEERLEIPSAGFVMMFAGNLGAAQSLDTIVSAAELLKEENIHWVFLGDGRRRGWLQSEVDNKQLDKVYLLGSRPMEMMSAYFSLADALLVTLRDDPVMATTIPSKVQSYLACGRPVIGALNGTGAKVVLESGAGYCVASGDAKGLAQAVLKMSQLSDAERDEMGLSAHRYYKKNFDRDMLVNQLEEWMRSSCGENQ
ncbi:Glycosyltransferase involved in cell wall bisynthesis [Mariprofundus aestuarium]|uniref:Glycosyltransferase involved in cell wall bisynthesis n=1 Tax=Mariprofundus aestuarium TaxID=1921086 RepID=A0A2K8KZA7_MARES|nr:glycosyltransferase family 4 protein [Mariprofundus aestuarium]ATX80273.1 Glycosyltransferase involved in cell wall bisynthesis [Mariprofundus aestuarium]